MSAAKWTRAASPGILALDLTRENPTAPPADPGVLTLLHLAKLKLEAKLLDYRNSGDNRRQQRRPSSATPPSRSITPAPQSFIATNGSQLLELAAKAISNDNATGTQETSRQSFAETKGCFVTLTSVASSVVASATSCRKKRSTGP